MSKFKMSKEVLILITVVVIVIAGIIIAICLGGNKDKQDIKDSQIVNIEGSVESIMERLYAGIPQEELPMMLGNTLVLPETIEYYVGTSDIEFEEAIASESQTGSIPHSVVLIRLKNADKADYVVSQIKEKADPRKWICVQASDVIVKNKGDLVVLIMSNSELAQKLEANFDGLN